MNPWYEQLDPNLPFYKTMQRQAARQPLRELEPHVVELADIDVRTVERDVWCPAKKRHVTATLLVKGYWSPKVQGVVHCPAFHDSGAGCHLGCLGSPTG